jgi:transposase
MADRRKGVVDIRAILMQLRAGLSQRQIERELKLNRRTVKKYRKWAQQHGLLVGELPPLEQLQALLAQTMPPSSPPQNVSTVERYRAVVEKLVKEKVETRAIYQRLQEQGFEGSYMAVYRFVRQFKGQPLRATVRVERQPGEEAQVDFGYAGWLIEPTTGKLRRAWVFVMTLSWSRHQYVEFVWDQKVETWLLCHRHGFEYLGGVPQRVVIDNLKAAIVKAVQDDPAVQASYQECALHYGFRIAPCRVRTPQHKGKVEQGGVHYVKRNFLGGRAVTTLTQANEAVLIWCQTTAGLRWHGTTKEQPLKRFEETERDRLQPLPTSPYELAVWKQLTLNRDCYLEFEESYYSAPYRLIGQPLLVCATLNRVRIFDKDYHLVATHQRAAQAGQRQTDLDHLPPELVPGLTLSREGSRQQAHLIGPATSRIVEIYLADPVVDRLATVGRLLGLQAQYGVNRLEAACVRALAFGDPNYRTIKQILEKGLEQAPWPASPTYPPATTFVRSPEELFGPQLGAARWN